MIIKENQEMSLISEDIFYSLSEHSRGMGIVIVNSFEGKGRNEFRKGANSELTNFIKLFEQMGLEVNIFTELDKEGIITKLQSFANDKRLDNHSMIGIAISSHGNESGILGVDREPVHHSQIQNIFSTKNCKQLANKPKLILLNACRGAETEEIICVDGCEKREIIKAVSIDNESCMADSMQDSDSDFFIVHSSHQGNQSFRSTKRGSFFIQEILSTYTQLGETAPLDLLMPIINRKVIDDCKVKNAPGAQSCNWRSTCSRILRIPPIGSVVKKEYSTYLVQPAVIQFDLIWATASRGKLGPNQMRYPFGLTITPSGVIFITDPASQCVWSYSSDGEPIYQFVEQDKPNPNIHNQLAITTTGLYNAGSICIRGSYLYISCATSIKRLHLDTGEHPIDKQLDHHITGIDIDEVGTMFACECETRKILLLDSNLNVLPEKLNLTHTLNRDCHILMDIKVLRESLYILVCNNEYSIQIFDKRGCHMKNLVSSGLLKESCFFTIDRTNLTIFAGDISTNELKGFNENGQLIYKTGGYGGKRGEFSRPMGIDLNANGEIVIVCAEKYRFMLQSFQPLC